MNSSDFDECIRDIDSALDRWLPRKTEIPAQLYEAMRYSSLAGGKRIRPILCLTVAEGLGTARQTAMKAACALEILHTYSLIHDDLPSMDNDDLRRGKPTNHKVFGEALAILSGDALLTLAFEWMADLTASGISSSLAVESIKVFAEAAGHIGMVGGQVLDIQGEGKKISVADLQNIHERKTGALIKASVEIGAILGKADEVQRRNLGFFGRKIGLLFQIVDDILDEEGDPARMGKKTGGDREKGKATYPSILGLEEAKKLASKTRSEAGEILAGLHPKIPILSEITEFIYNRSN